jgi:hypothetical protein
MKAHEFIEKNIGNRVYVTGDRDLAFNGGLREIIFKKTELTVVKLTRGGLAYLMDDKNRFYAVPPRNVREVDS